MNQKFLKITLALTVLIFAYSLWNRAVDVDDAWLAEHAYWLSEMGFVKSELMRGITNQEVRVLLHHKLLIAVGALSIKGFGLSVYILKSLTLLCFGAFLGFFYKFTVLEKAYFNRKDFGFAVLILLSHALVFRFAFVFRPEVFMMFFGFLNFIFLNRTLSNFSIKNAALTGFFAALCLLTHLNGIAFLGASFLLIAWEKQWKSLGWYSLVGGLTCLTYFWDFTMTYDFSFWFDQLNNNPYHKAPFGTQILFNLLNEQMRFFHSTIEIAFSVFLISSLCVSYPILRQKHLILLRFSLLLILILAALSLYKTTKYMIPYLPYLVMMIVLSWKYLYEKEFEPLNWTKRFSIESIKNYFWLLIFLYLGIQHFFNFHLAIKKYDTTFNQALTEIFIRTPVQKTKVIAPMSFIFNEIERFERIQSEISFYEMQKSEPDLKGEKFLQRALEYDIDYILLSPEYQKILGVQHYNNPAFSSYYRSKGYFLDGILVLEKNDLIY